MRMATFKRPRASDQEAHDDHSPPRLSLAPKAPRRYCLRGKAKTFECFTYKPSAELLRLNKSAVRKYNEEHGSIQHVQ